MMVDFLQKYNGTASVELIDCHQERPLRFFSYCSRSSFTQENTEANTEEEEAMKKIYGNHRRKEDTMIRADGIQNLLEVYRPLNLFLLKPMMVKLRVCWVQMSWKINKFTHDLRTCST